MIKIFRKFRQKMVSGNRVGKYLLYAIGEIVLVVLGILIALQVNNWNEARKDHEMEIKVLSELLITINRNCDEMNLDAIRRQNWNKSSDIIISTLNNGTSYSDTLNIHFHNARIPGTNLSLSSAGYEGFKNVGYNIIRSDELRNEIIELFEVTMKRLMEEMEYFESFQPDRQQYIDRLFSYEDDKFDRSKPFSVPIEPHNFNALKDDLNFISMIKSVKVQRNIIAVILDENLKESMQVIQLINHELGVTIEK
jgi:hypothetical protein